jgi:putative FmdB family regulatory protein
MPTYEYACSACGHTFEAFQSIKAGPVTVCPKCKKRKVKRLISAGGGFIFKGSGFYTTDYRSDSYKSAAKSDVPKTDTPKTDAKPATPAAPAAPAAKTESKEAPKPQPAPKPSSHAAKAHSKK